MITYLFMRWKPIYAPSFVNASESRANRRSTEVLPGEALFTPLYKHRPWQRSPNPVLYFQFWHLDNRSG